MSNTEKEFIEATRLLSVRSRGQLIFSSVEHCTRGASQSLYRWKLFPHRLLLAGEFDGLSLKYVH
jgi:hypothetical protein